MQVKFAPRFMEPQLHLVQSAPMPEAPELSRFLFRDLRKRHGLTQEVVAEAVGLSKEHVSKLERDIASPSMQALEAFAELFGCDVVDLFRSSKKVTDEENHLLDRYRSLNRTGRQAIRNLADTLSSPDAA